MSNITLKQAQNIIEHSLEFARKQGLPPLALVVLDAGAHVKASVCEDRAGTLRYEIALGKASAALGMGFGTRQFHQLIKQGVLPEMFASTINGAAKGAFIPLPGGVLIVDGSGVIGAIGISGANSDSDERVALYAIDKTGLRASP